MSEAPRLTRHKTVREALQYVADNPYMTTAPIDTPVWELVARILFELANNPEPKVRGSLARATKAQRIIADRLVGTRRRGTHPSEQRKQEVMFLDLTMKEVSDGSGA